MTADSSGEELRGMRHPGGIHGVLKEHRRKRRAARGIVPTPIEWAGSQPEQWRLICHVFAVNINTPGGVTDKTIDDIVKTAKARGVRISRRTLFRYLPELERYGVVRQEHHHFYTESGEILREPSTWLVDLRKAMPSFMLPPLVYLDRDAENDARNAAWLEAHNLTWDIANMHARVAAQPTEPPF